MPEKEDLDVYKKDDSSSTLTSAQTVAVNSICAGGVDTYLSGKHREHMVEGLEAGLLGAFIGTLLTIGVSYSGYANNIKPTHAWFPALIGFSSAVLAAYTTMKNDDDDHIEDFEKVCVSGDE